MSIIPIILKKKKLGSGLNQIDAATILADGNTVAWYDYTVSVTKDGSNLVSSWGDKSGNSRHLLQASGERQPLWSSNGILFDGVNDFLKTAAFTYNQPEMIYMVLKMKSWVSGAYITDGNGTESCNLLMTATTPGLKFRAGTISAQNNNLPVDTLGIVRILVNGANSKLQINETSATTGDFGAANAGGLTLCARGNGSSGYSNVEFKEVILRKTADIEANETLIYNYLKSKYSI